MSTAAFATLMSRGHGSAGGTAADGAPCASASTPPPSRASVSMRAKTGRVVMEESSKASGGVRVPLDGGSRRRAAGRSSSRGPAMRQAASFSHRLRAQDAGPRSHCVVRSRKCRSGEGRGGARERLPPGVATPRGTPMAGRRGAAAVHRVAGPVADDPGAPGRRSREGARCDKTGLPDRRSRCRVLRARTVRGTRCAKESRADRPE